MNSLELFADWAGALLQKKGHGFYQACKGVQVTTTQSCQLANSNKYIRLHGISEKQRVLFLV